MNTTTASYTYAGKDLNHDWIEPASAIPDTVIVDALGGDVDQTSTLAEFIVTTNGRDIDNMIKQNQVILHDDITVTKVYYHDGLFNLYAGRVGLIGETVDELTGATRVVEAVIDVDAVQAPYVDEERTSDPATDGVGAQVNEALMLRGVSLIDVIDDDNADMTRGWRMAQAIDAALKSGIDVTISLTWRPTYII